METLSKQLVGLVLDHQTLRFHLDRNNEPIDEELEKKTFAAFGYILAKAWNGLQFDGLN